MAIASMTIRTLCAKPCQLTKQHNEKNTKYNRNKNLDNKHAKIFISETINY